MTRMVCPACGGEQKGGAPLCPLHAIEFVPARGESPEPPAATAPAGTDTAAGGAPSAGQPGHPLSAGGRAPGTPQECWNCGEPAPDAGNACCAACGEPLAPPRLVLTFATGQVALYRNQITQLGRDRTRSPHARLFEANNHVSRLHAAVGVDGDGNAWIHDQESSNGTFVNDREIPAIPPTPLTDGDRIRLGADTRADVHVYREQA
jgi:hypothetical protein